MMILECVGCGRRCSSAEASTRKFNTGRCAMCNNELRVAYDLSGGASNTEPQQSLGENRTHTREDF